MHGTALHFLTNGAGELPNFHQMLALTLIPRREVNMHRSEPYEELTSLSHAHPLPPLEPDVSDGCHGSWILHHAVITPRRNWKRASQLALACAC